MLPYPLWVGLGNDCMGLTLKITFCNLFTTCSNIAWDDHMLHDMPVACKIKRSHKVVVKSQIISKQLGRSLGLVLVLKKLAHDQTGPDHDIPSVEWTGSPMSGIPCAQLGIATSCHTMSGMGASVPFHFPSLLYWAS